MAVEKKEQKVFKEGTTIIFPNGVDTSVLPEDMTEEELIEALKMDDSCAGVTTDSLTVDENGNVHVGMPKSRVNGL